MSDLNEHNLKLSRVLNAPVERVWRAWTDVNEIQKWWGPAGVTNPTCVWEVRPGGNINIVMLAGPELGELAGQQWPMTGEFKEVVPEKKLVFSSRAIVDNQPVLETLCSLTLEGDNGKTNMTLNITVTRVTPEAAGPLAGMSMGWNQSLDKLTKNVEAQA